jgi:hypothetical protein
MREVWEIIKERYFSFGKSVSSNLLERVKVRNALLKLCEEYLHNSDDVLVFEVMASSLPFAVAVINDEIIASQYQIVQVSETLFEARMVVLEVL